MLVSVKQDERAHRKWIEAEVARLRIEPLEDREDREDRAELRLQVSRWIATWEGSIRLDQADIRLIEERITDHQERLSWSRRMLEELKTPRPRPQ